MANVFFMTRVNSSKAIDGLDKYSAKVREMINKSTHDSGLIIEGEVKNSIAGRRGEPRSVDTGHFMQTITTDNSRPYISEVYSAVEYSKYLEFGTSRIMARHHFTNTLLRQQAGVVDRLVMAIKK